MSHRHTVKTLRTVGYSHPVGPYWQQDQRAHGGVCFIEECKCGAVKKTNSNGLAKETTGWVLPEKGS